MDSIKPKPKLRVIHLQTELVTRFAVVDEDDDVVDLKEAHTQIKKFCSEAFQETFGELQKARAQMAEMVNGPEAAER